LSCLPDHVTKPRFEHPAAGARVADLCDSILGRGFG
jgi:hypothetical protein